MRRLALALATTLAACGSAPPAATAARPNILPISADELRRDVFAFAADSMQGRETGTAGAGKAARFIAQRLIALGIEPGGDSMYFQRVSMVREGVSPDTRISVNTGTSTGTGTSTSTTSAPSTGSSSQQTTTTVDPERGGIEMPGQPACYKPAANVTERRMYNESRPACAGEQQ